MDAVLLIPTLDRPDDLRLTLEHVIPLLDARLRLILVDDASTDPEHMRLLAEVRRECAFVEVIRHETRQGCTRARKRVLDTLQTDVVIMLDDDSHFVHVTRAEIDLLIERFAQEPRLGAQALPCFVPSRDANLDAVLERVYDGRLVSGFINCACAVRMEAYHDIGGYCEAFDSPYGEERDLCLRLLEHNWTIRQYASPAVVHYQSAISRNKEHNAAGNALNYFRFIWWYHPVWFALPYSVSTLLKLIRNGLRYGQSLRGVTSGTIQFLRETPRLRRRPVRPETLRIFYSLKRRTATSSTELATIEQHSWTRVLLEQILHPSYLDAQTDDGRAPRWWKRITTNLIPL